MDVMTAIRERRSIRSYLDKEVEPEKIEKLLESMQYAPGARNEQGHVIVMIRDKELKKEVAEACNGQMFVAEAPVIFVMCYNNERIMSCGQMVGPVDATIAFSFLMLEVKAQDLGMCWIGAFDAEEIKRILNVPEDYTVFALASIGYPANEGYFRERKSLKELVRFDRWEEWV